MKHLIKI